MVVLHISHIAYEITRPTCMQYEQVYCTSLMTYQGSWHVGPYLVYPVLGGIPLMARPLIDWLQMGKQRVGWRASSCVAAMALWPAWQLPQDVLAAIFPFQGAAVLSRTHMLPHGRFVLLWDPIAIQRSAVSGTQSDNRGPMRGPMTPILTGTSLSRLAELVDEGARLLSFKCTN
jgi:hypothetical protein